MQIWGGWWDLNPRVPEPQSGALTASPQPPCQYWNGAPGEIRTPDNLLRRQMLYPTELQAPNNGIPLRSPRTYLSRLKFLLFRAFILEPRTKNLKQKRWSGQRDLNPRPPAPKAGALPSCAIPRIRDKDYFIWFIFYSQAFFQKIWIPFFSLTLPCYDLLLWLIFINLR